MALKGLGVNHLGAEFRRGEFAPFDSFELLKAPLAVCVVLIAALFGLILVYGFLNNRKLTNLEGDIHDRMEAAFREAYAPVEGITAEDGAGEEASARGTDRGRGRQTGRTGGSRTTVPIPATTAEMWDRLHSEFIGALSKGKQKGLPQCHSAIDVWKEIMQVLARMGREDPYERLRNGEIRRAEWENDMPFPARGNATNQPSGVSVREGRLPLEFSIVKLEVRNRGAEFRLEVRCHGIREIEQIVNALNENELFQGVRHDGLEIPEPEEGSRGRIVDNRPNTTIRGEIVQPEQPKPRGTTR